MCVLPVRTTPKVPSLTPQLSLSITTLHHQVRKVKGSKYCVGQVASTGGPLWVERERVRMSPKGARNLGKRGDHGPSFFGREAAAALGSTCSIM